MDRQVKKYDVVVIGGGTAGSNAARAARNAGAQKVALIHLPALLNTCAEEGCMPSKSIIHSAQVGLSFEEGLKRMDGHIDRLLEGLQELLTSEDFEILEGEASFLSPSILEVKQGASVLQIEGNRFVIATGSSSFTPPVSGLKSVSQERILTSEHVVSHKHITDLPDSIFILGGGPIGLEMLHIFHDFGSTVYLAERGHLLSRMDKEFGEAMEKTLHETNGVTLLTESVVKGVREEDGIVVSVEVAGDVVEYKADALLIATGRHANVEDLELEKAEVLCDEKGIPQFDSTTLQTTNPNIYIAGDVTGTYQILHFASEMGRVAGENAGSGQANVRVDYDRINMGIIFSEPQIGHIGLTESAALEKNIAIVTTTLDIPNIGRGLLENQPVGIWKIVAEKKSGKIIGAQAIGPSPHTEWFVDLIAWIIYFKGTIHDLRDKKPYYHPTYPELLQTMGRDLCSKIGTTEDDIICPN